MAQKLLTKQNLRDLPAIYAQDGKGDAAIAHVKFFLPGSGWTWYVTEYDPDEDQAFGLVIGHVPELGYISIAELRTLRGRFGPVERDLHWHGTIGDARRAHGVAAA